MQASGVKVGKVFGVELWLDYSWFILFFLIALTFTAGLLPTQLHADVQGGTLFLGQEINLLYVLFVWSLPKPTYFVAVRNIDSLTVSGAHNVEITQLKVPSLSIKGSGSSKIAASLLVENLEVTASGSLKATLSGSAKTQSVRTSGSSNYEALDLHTQTTIVRSSGSSRISVRVEKQLDVSASGSVGVNYKGSPQINQKISGAVKITNVE